MERVSYTRRLTNCCKHLLTGTKSLTSAMNKQSLLLFKVTYATITMTTVLSCQHCKDQSGILKYFIPYDNL